jgi:hypothetical protein
MTYYVRAFCTDGEVPTIGTVLAWAAQHDLDPPPDMPEFVTQVGEPPPDWGQGTPEELASRDWNGVALWWRKDWTPMDVTIHDRHDWEADQVAALPPSRQRDQVLAHLARTRYVVSISLPISALEDDALWEAVSVLLDYFAEHHGALAHIEGEGSFWARRMTANDRRTSKARSSGL